MSAGKRSRPLRALQGIVGYLLALLLTLSLVATGAVALAHQLLTDQALHERVAQDERVLDQQLARVEETVREMAERYHFAPSSVMDGINRESLKQYNRELVAWWMGLMAEHPSVEAPLPDTEAMEEAIRADELFRENTSEFVRRSIARDDVAYPISVAMREAAMPLRVSLVALGMPKLAERVDIPELMGLVGTARAALLALCGLLLLLTLLTQGRRRWLCVSASLLAAFILAAAVTALTAAADLPGQLGAYSPMLSLQLCILMRELAGPALMAEGALLLAGALTLGLWLRAAGRKRG